MDNTEAWLRQHDPEYLRSRQGWKQLNADGEYETPSQEVLAGASDQAATKGRPIVAGCYVRCRCGQEFVQREAKHRNCSETCQQRFAKRRQRGAA